MYRGEEDRMNREEMAGKMLEFLYAGRVDEVGTICEAIIACREQVKEDRLPNRSSRMYTPEESVIVMNGGELAEEVLELLRREDLYAVEMALRACKA